MGGGVGRKFAVVFTTLRSFEKMVDTFHKLLIRSLKRHPHRLTSLLYTVVGPI